MAKQKTYSEKLKDPRWQKKRLEVLNRDNFACRRCGDDKSTLHVHHLKYSKEPWDVPSEFLITLCEPCHKDEEIERPETERFLLQVLKERGFLSLSIFAIAEGFYRATNINPLWDPTPDIIAHCIRYRWDEMQNMFWDDLKKKQDGEKNDGHEQV